MKRIRSSNEIGRIWRGVLTVLSLLLFLFASSQEVQNLEEKSTAAIQDKIEQIAESSDANLDFTELIEDLKYFYENPLNLNYASDDELERLGILNPMQLFNLKSYRESFGLLQSIYELQAIDGFDKQTIQNLLPFVMVSAEAPNNNIRLKNTFKYGKHQLLARGQTVLQEREGYKNISDSSLFENPNSRYLGSPERYYLRYGFNYKNQIRFGITAEKDPGEVLFLNSLNDSIRKLTNGKVKSGFDFYSAHAVVNNIGPIKTLAIGDYQLRFGQGLTLWSGLAFGKSADAVNVKKHASGISPYTSTDENRFFRGAAVSIALKNITLSLFASDKKVDASINARDSIQDFSQEPANLYETGLHRTLNEVLKKDRVQLKAFGGNLNFSGKNFQVGVTGIYSEFGNRIQKTDVPYNAFNFAGKYNTNAGIDYSFMLSRINFFGEIALSQNQGLANIHGIAASLHSRFSVALIYRNYSRSYQNFFSNAFSESYNQNEKGLYSGFRLDISKRLLLSAYFDLFSYPWLRFGVDGPSHGNDLLAQMDYQMNRQVSMQFRVKHKLKQFNMPENPGYSPSLINDRKWNLRYQVMYELSPSLTGKNRIEYVLHKKGVTYRGLGYLLYQDLKWASHESKFAISTRYAIFDTDSYDERIYSYENDILYAFSVPAYYYRGSKVYFMITYRINKNIKCWARINHTWLSDRNTMGSGLDLIEGNQKTEFKLMFQLKI